MMIDGLVQLLDQHMVAWDTRLFGNHASEHRIAHVPPCQHVQSLLLFRPGDVDALLSRAVASSGEKSSIFIGPCTQSTRRSRRHLWARL
jgi:hypothetical protein